MRTAKRTPISTVKTAGISNPITMWITTGKAVGGVIPGTVWG
jgi:hypothetical protein